MVRLSILARKNLLELLADILITPLAIHILSPLAHLNGVLVDELCNLNSDLNSGTVSNDTIGPITIDHFAIRRGNLQRRSVINLPGDHGVAPRRNGTIRII